MHEGTIQEIDKTQFEAVSFSELDRLNYSEYFNPEDTDKYYQEV